MRSVGRCERAKPKIGWERIRVPADDSVERDVCGTCSWVGSHWFTFGFVCDRVMVADTITNVRGGISQPLHKDTHAPSPPPSGLAILSRVRVGVRASPDPDLTPGFDVCRARERYSTHMGGQTNHCTSTRARLPPLLLDRLGLGPELGLALTPA